MTAGMFAATSGLLLLILNRDTSGSCVHGKVMPYCIEISNSTSFNSTIKDIINLT
uniref:Uncharacterized protein n=1 Tax=Apis cerana TaxID=7461 RepID=V9IBS6_APICE